MTSLPTGTVTLLFTDIVGSTRMLENIGAKEYGRALEAHDDILRGCAARAGGHTFGRAGDALFFAFSRASSALEAALAMQRDLHAQREALALPEVRMGLHTGEVHLVGDDYVGLAVHIAHRVSSLAHGSQILLSAATASVAAPEMPGGTSIIELGTVRLKGVEQPERIFQLAHPNLRADFPPLETITTVRHNLPSVGGAFIGRTAEIDELAARATTQRLITIVGPGGCGKTRISLEVARRGGDAFPDGVWFVDLAPLSDASQIEDAIRVAVDITTGRDPAGAVGSDQTLTDAIGSARLMVLLDNCEHVIEDVANVVHALLEGSPNVHVIATSREPLRLRDESVFLLLPLPTPKDDEDAEHNTAVKLFESYAKQHDRSFSLDGDTLAVVADICRKLDGLPLAIELAAAHVRALPVATIRDRLERDALSMLRGSARDRSDRHQTLTATIGWGFRLLERDQARLLERLNVFPGSFTLDAAEEICAGDGIDAGDVYPLLSVLLDRSMVQRVEGKDEPRYRILAMIRLFLSKLEPEEEHATRWTFRREGEVWAIGSARIFRLKDAKGLGYLHRLLREPEKDHNVLDLTGAALVSEHADELADPKTLATYRARLRDLDEEIEEATAFSDDARLARARTEREALVDELGRLTGLGGRARKTNTVVERARTAVTKAIRSAIDRIEAEDPELGSHLRKAVQTGVICRYDDGSTAWDLGREIASHGSAGSFTPEG